MKALNVSFDMWVVLVVLLVVVASVAAAQGEPRVGTWELNLAQSTFNPGPPPKKQTLTFQSAGPQWTALLQGILAAISTPARGGNADVPDADASVKLAQT